MLIAVIGTAGRGDDKPRMTKRLYTLMYNRLLLELADIPITERHVRSGGAAWADYLAVSLFKGEQLGTLNLYLPAEWDWEKHQFKDIGVRDFRRNPGGTSNYHYQAFSKACQQPTLQLLENCLAALRDNPTKGAFHIVPGFHNRNTPVSQVDRLIAFTWGEGDTPKDGGTKDTWDKCKSTDKRHIPLAKLLEEDK